MSVLTAGQSQNPPGAHDEPYLPGSDQLTDGQDEPGAANSLPGDREHPAVIGGGECETGAPTQPIQQ